MNNSVISLKLLLKIEFYRNILNEYNRAHIKSYITFNVGTYMKLFANSEEMNLYFLPGVEDYLTDSAKKHRRNLVYSTFVIFVLSYMNYSSLVEVKEFTSVFGFKLVEQGQSDAGIPFTIVIGMLLAACSWELFMLISYKRACDAQWYGHLMVTEEGKNQAKTARILLQEQYGAKLSIQDLDKIRSNLDYVVNDVTKSVSTELEVTLIQAVADGPHQMFATQLNQILHRHNGRLPAGESLEPLFERVMTEASKQNEQLTESVENEIKKACKRFEEYNTNAINGIKYQLENYNKYQKQTLEHLKLIARHKHQSQLTEFYLPVLLGTIGVLVAIFQVFNLSLICI